MVENPKDGEVYWSISTRDGDDNLVSPIRPWSGKLKRLPNLHFAGGWLVLEGQRSRGTFLYARDLYATEAEAKAAYNKAAITMNIVITVERPEPTPGPWEIGLLKNCTEGFPDSLAVLPAGAVASKNRGPAICCVSAAKTADLQDEANARLIAAAPDLLAALKAMWAWQGTVQEVVPDAVAELVQDAIAKAEGK